jgi:cellulose synthase/poly-beta-1,6-N-acetylglucosamine synthase-like glycosyltransferase
MMSLRWLPWIALVLLNIAVIPWFLLIFATSLAATRARRRRLGSEEPRSRLLIVIPAHDEESGIATTVQSCRAANYPAALFGVVVIADNCSDRTASVAAHAGSRVVERLDPARKSKGYAIAFLLETLLQSGEFESLDALVFIDADTTIDPDLLRHFDQDLREGRDWIQCYYTVANPDQTWRTRLLTYGFSLFNGVILLGLSALGTSAAFRGNGMCFSTRGLRRRPWRSYGLVEDMEYSWILRVAGEKIAFQPAASVYGAMPGSGGRATASQRRRWEFGRMEVRKKYLLPLLRTEQLGWWEKTLSSCELAMPTMTGLMIVYVLVAALDAWAVFASGTRELPFVRWSLFASGLFMTASLCLYALSPFLAMRLPWKYASSLAFFPFYMSWKLLIALGGRPKQWVRTARESQTGGLG